MAGKADRGVARDRECAAQRADQERIDDRAHLVQLIEDLLEVRERQYVAELDALAPLLDKGTRRDAGDRHDDREREPQRDQRECNPLPRASGA